jgi:hypothetical protein
MSKSPGCIPVDMQRNKGDEFQTRMDKRTQIGHTYIQNNCPREFTFLNVYIITGFSNFGHRPKSK